jgi:hypothetical protein
MNRQTLPVFALTFVLSLLVVASSASAGDVYLNGVKVDGLRDQLFQNADVRFDGKGDVHITVKGVTVQVQGAPGSVGQTAAAPGLQHHYFLVSSKTSPGATQYDIQVHINGQFVTKCRSADGQLAMDVTRFLRPGQNQIVFTAFKNLADARKAFGSDQKFTLILGRGKSRGDQIVIERTLSTYVRTAADVSNDSHAVTVAAD